ncbi:hypothetical protein KO361_05525 [Candidatus Woesearchaeota archaeon]|jgi:hypothetical protein|nr:hypothetical protein [Candidatus Woesearchaeota archaeon]
MISIITLVIILFLISWLISAIIIHLSASILGKRKGFWTAMVTALIGSIIYTTSYYFIQNNLLSSTIAGLTWLIILKTLYKTRWIRTALIALTIWILNTITSIFLPMLF